MDEFEDNLDRLASSGVCRRRSSAVGLPLSTAYPNGVGDKRDSMDKGRSAKQEVTVYRVLVLGSHKVGKTAIISQFLYDQFQPRYKPTVEEMYKGDFEVGNIKISLNIEDTCGTFAYDFPAMAEVSLASADVVLLVYSVDDCDSFEQVAMLRDLVMKSRGPDMPMVVVGNKIDLERKVDEKETEVLVECDWENGYVECSAKLNKNIEDVFMELLNQAKSKIDFSPNSGNISSHSSSLAMRRRQSLPVVPVFNRGVDTEQRQKKKEGGRRSSIAVSIKKESCKVS